MMMLDLLKSKAIDKGFLKPEEDIDAEKAFLLVRDMPYSRASTRDPETIFQVRGIISFSRHAVRLKQ